MIFVMFALRSKFLPRHSYKIFFLAQRIFTIHEKECVCELTTACFFFFLEASRIRFQSLAIYFKNVFVNSLHFFEVEKLFGHRYFSYIILQTNKWKHYKIKFIFKMHFYFLLKEWHSLSDFLSTDCKYNKYALANYTLFLRNFQYFL